MRGYKEGGEEKELLDTKYRIQSFQDKEYEKTIFIIFENIGFSINHLKLVILMIKKYQKKYRYLKCKILYIGYGIQNIGHRTLYIY